ncbi:CLC4E protein, partial [Polypterus senegalus]
MNADVVYSSVNFSKKKQQQSESESQKTTDPLEDVINTDIQTAKALTLQQADGSNEGLTTLSLDERRSQEHNEECNPCSSESDFEIELTMKTLAGLQKKGNVTKAKENRLFFKTDTELKQESINGNNTVLAEEYERVKKMLTALETRYGELHKNHVSLQSQYGALNKNHTNLTAQYEVLNKSHDSQTCSVCPQNWLLFISKCYFLSTDKLGWSDSQDHCFSERGHLVIIENKEEQDFLTVMVEIKGGKEKSYWIGLSDRVTEGDFVWVNDRPLDPRKRFWGKRESDNGQEPDNWTDKVQSPTGEDCVELKKSKSYNGCLREYDFTYMKKVVQEKSCGQNYTLFLEENKDLQREVTQLKERVTAVDEACPVRSTSVQGQTCSVCPYGWMLFNSSCYFFSTDYLKWNESQNHCTSVGGYLVIIEDEEEQNILTALVDIKGAMDKSYWIGLTDQKIEGQYVWVNNKTLKSNQGFWGKKEHDSGKDPDNWTDNGKLPAGEDCVHIQKTQRYSGWFWGRREHDNSLEPDNWTDKGKHPKGEDCVHLQILRQNKGWYDAKCDNKKKSICEAAAVSFSVST